ncbi:hypothetical protein ETH_00040250 [Eimeria tenella]|uniref:Uncharacterized protein n=1 Tax=Eimeria tenella TaxID=5802 RepID=U6LB25_EIMTE|nr:hypothetical protein ETH_00040250 [Eimeria tenella]CDJ44930.1 hypothetical protein ETH_00040250 [Eimeria tenella]|eukprot:XP_013235677.1 hypothetical protein ETH_00040250 [Eimeria tenella]
MVNAVAAFGLMQLLHQLKKNTAAAPQELLQRLHDPNTLGRLLTTLVCIHHESIRGAQGAHEGSSSSRAAAAADSSFPIVAAVVKLDKTWPEQRAPRVSRLLALHNLLFVKTLLGFLYRTRHLLQQQQQQQQQGGEGMEVDEPAAAAAASFEELLQQGLAPVLKGLFEAPNSELDKHITAVEVAAAAAAAAAKWEDPKARETLWNILCPLMASFECSKP